jgi:hypothetical protein
MKVIFLDFDGVINDYMTFNEINKCNVEVLKTIIDNTDAKVVVTSSHKYLWQRNNIHSIRCCSVYTCSSRNRSCFKSYLGFSRYNST